MASDNFTPADFAPDMLGYSGIEPFRFWCQKVLPTAYDDSLSYYELLNKVVDLLNKTIVDVSNAETNIKNLNSAYIALQDYVNNYFENLSVQEEINTKLDQMALDGSLTALIEPLVPSIISDWLEEHITPTTPVVDDSLTVEGAAADSKTVGDLILVKNVGGGTVDADEFVSNSLWRFGSIATVTHAPASVTVGCILTIGQISDTVTVAQQYQLCWGANNNRLYFRSSKYDNTEEANIYSDWIWVGNNADIVKKLNNVQPVFADIDGDTLDANTIYRFGRSYNASNVAGVRVGLIATLGLESGSTSTLQKYQLLFDSESDKYYFRTSTYDTDTSTNVYNPWHEIATTGNSFPLTANASTIDANTASPDTLYRFGANSTKQNMPSTVEVGELMTVGLAGNSATTAQKYQILWDSLCDCFYYRCSHYSSGSNPYGQWQELQTKRPLSYKFVTYNSGDVKATLAINIPSNSGYTAYRFVRAESAAKNSNIWCIRDARAYNKKLTSALTLTENGEWDFAVRIGQSGSTENPLRSDFSGGMVHGDEKTSSVNFWVDGVEKTVEQFIQEATDTGGVYLPCQEIRCVQTSNVYDPGDEDHLAIIGVHSCERVWNADGYHVKQKFTWSVSQNVSRGYMIMLPISKTYSTNFYTDEDYLPALITRTSSDERTNVGEAVMYSANYLACVKSIDAKRDTFISDNSGAENYNKLYFKQVPFNTAVTAGDVWVCESHYDFRW